MAYLLFMPECRSRYRKLGMLATVIGAVWLCIDSITLHAAEADTSPSEQPAAEQILELSIEQLMHLTLTSAAKKEQSLVETATAIFVITS